MVEGGAGAIPKTPPSSAFKGTPKAVPYSGLRDVSYLKQRRKHIRAKVTRITSDLKGHQQSGWVATSDVASKRIAELTELRENLLYYNDLISKEIFNEEESEENLNRELDSNDSYNDAIREAIVDLNRNSQNDSRPIPTSLNDSRNLRLPILPLPEYGHNKGESLEKFLSNFESIINKHNLTPYERYVYLTGQLSNGALTLVESLHGEHQCYEEARALLMKAFASPLTQKYEAIERMTKLNLSYQGDPYTFVSEYRVVSHLITNLDIDVSTILQYFVWRGMNDLLQDQLVTICNTNKPDIKQIDSKLFEAVERYNVLLERKSFNPKSSAPNINLTSLAANVNSNFHASPAKQSIKVKENKNKDFRACLLCSADKRDSAHPIYRCQSYPTSNLKLEKLRTLRACMRCANMGHCTKDCEFKFKNCCRYCSSYHFSFLCDKPGPLEKKPNNSDLQCKTASIKFNIFQSQFSSDTILPTF